MRVSLIKEVLRYVVLLFCLGMSLGWIGRSVPCAGLRELSGDCSIGSGYLDGWLPTSEAGDLGLFEDVCCLLLQRSFYDILR